MKNWNRIEQHEIWYESKWGRIWRSTQGKVWSISTPITEIYATGFNTQWEAARFLRELWPEEQKMVAVKAITADYHKQAGKLAAKYGAHV